MLFRSKSLAARRAVVLADILHPLSKFLALKVTLDLGLLFRLAIPEPIDEFPSQLLRFRGLPVLPDFLNFDYECPQMNGGILAQNRRFVSRAEAR